MDVGHSALVTAKNIRLRDKNVGTKLATTHAHLLWDHSLDFLWAMTTKIWGLQWTSSTNMTIVGAPMLFSDVAHQPTIHHLHATANAWGHRGAAPHFQLNSRPLDVGKMTITDRHSDDRLISFC